MLLDRSKLLVTGTAAVLALMSSGCGRTQSSLLPRVNVGQLIDEGSETQTRESAEQYANEQIDAELRGRKSNLADTSKAVLASAEKEGRSWKDRLISKKPDLPTADDFAADPFLDNLDGMIAKQEERLKETATQTTEKLSDFEAAELFGDMGEKAADSMAGLDRAASETVAQTQDVFGAAAEDIFGSPSATSPAEPHPLEQASRNGAGRQTVAQRVKGAVVHRFDDLFDEAKSKVSQVASQTTETAGNVLAAAAPAPREPHQLNIEPVRTEIPVPVEMPITAEVSIPKVPEIRTEAIAEMFDPPEVTVPEAVEVAVALPEMPNLPELPPVRDVVEDAIAGFEQQDAVVTPNRPATLPTAQPELSDSDFAAMERVEVDPYEEPSFAVTPAGPSSLSAPSFGEAPSFGDEQPESPAIDRFPPVEIPQEPAPRFAAQEPTPPAMQVQRVAQSNRPMPPTTFAPPQQPPAVAAVLPDVNWQGQSATPRKLRAPSEWTAWFLMGGAALIVMLLFAPGRRE